MSRRGWVNPEGKRDDPRLSRKAWYNPFYNWKRYRGSDWIGKLYKSWYYWAKKDVPEMDSQQYTQFISGSAGIVLSALLYDRGVASKVSIQIGSGVTATMHFDELGKWVITLPLWSLSPAFYRALMPDASEAERTMASVVMVNGLLVHEALHVRFTDSSKESLVYEILKPSELGHRKAEFLLMVDMVEDLYIENKAGFWLSEYLQGVGHILINDEVANALMEEFESAPNVKSLVGLLSLLNVDKYADDAWDCLPDNIQNIVGSIPSKRTSISRARLALELVRLFPDQGFKPVASPDGNLKWDQSDWGEDNFAGNRALHPSKGELNDAIKEMSKERTPRSVIEDRMSQELKDSTYGWVGNKYYVHGSSQLDKVPAVEERDVTSSPYHSDFRYAAEGTKFLRSDEDYGFVRRLKALRVVNRVPGLPEDSGPNIIGTRLARIVTDGKIFAKQYEDTRYTRVEVILLVDLSGSTSHDYGDGNLYLVELRAAYHMFLALREANVPCAVYIHTSGATGSTVPGLVHVTSYDMPGTHTEPEKAFVLASAWWRRENYDGFILERIAQKFSGKKARKVIIHLSDGIPSGNNYRETAAVEHTMGIIKWLRSIGISVFSLSTAYLVVEKNDMIYGKEYNLDASKNLDSQMKALVEKLM